MSSRVFHKLAGAVQDVASIPHDFVGVRAYIGPDMKVHTTRRFDALAPIRSRVDNPSQMCSTLYDEITPIEGKPNKVQRYRVFIERTDFKETQGNATTKRVELQTLEGGFTLDDMQRHQTQAVTWRIVLFGITAIWIVILLAVYAPSCAR